MPKPTTLSAAQVEQLIRALTQLVVQLDAATMIVPPDVLRGAVATEAEKARALADLLTDAEAVEVHHG